MSANEKKPPWKGRCKGDEGGVHRRNFSREVRGREKRGTTPDGDVRTEMKMDASLGKKKKWKKKKKKLIKKKSRNSC